MEASWLEMAQSVAALAPSDFERLYSAQEERAHQDELLRARFYLDRPAFLTFCFPRAYYLPWCDFHRWALGQHFQDGRWQPDPTKRKVGWLEGWSPERGIARPNDLQAVAAPRGIAKTTIGKGDIVHDIVYGLEGVILVLSAGQRLATKIVKGIRAMLRPGTPLDQLYGPFVIQGGVEEYSVSVRGAEPVSIAARSFGTEVRGENVGADSIRPTKVVIDDGEKRLEVANPDNRKKWWEFLTEDVLKMGPREGGFQVQFRGTVLHPDSVLARLLEDPGWTSRKWKALISWPTRMDLWEECGRIWRNLALGDLKFRETMARRFYEANREAMDEGASVLDPVALPLFRIFEIIWSQGMRAFLKELQNEPTDPATRFFDPSRFQRFRVEHVNKVGPVAVVLNDKGEEVRRVEVSKLRLTAFLDPIPGVELDNLSTEAGAGDGDSASIAVVGRDEHGFGYVLDVWMARCRDSDMRAALWTLCERWGVKTVGVESNGFQRLVTRQFRAEQKMRRQSGQFWRVQIVDVGATEKKEERIARLEPDLHGGWLLVNEAISPVVLSQFSEFPTGSHDDGPDSIEGAWSMAGGSPGPSMETMKRIR